MMNKPWRPRAAWLRAIRLSWPLALPLALLSYLVLHSMAGLPVPQPAGVSNLSSFVTAQLIQGLGSWLQYLLPALFCLLMIPSLLKPRQRLAPGLPVLEGLGWEEFELLVAAAFAQRGYTVRSRGGRQAGGGVDLVLTRGREVYLLQAQHWRAAQVGLQALRELQAVMAAARASGGFVLCAGQFSAAARQFAGQHAIELIGGTALQDLLEGLAAALPTVAGRPAALAAMPRERESEMS